MVESFRGVLTVSQSLPELNFLISARVNNLTVVKGEGDREDILLVVNDLTDSLTGLDVP